MGLVLEHSVALSAGEVAMWEREAGPQTPLCNWRPGWLLGG